MSHSSTSTPVAFPEEGCQKPKKDTFPFKFVQTTDFHFQTDYLIGRECDFESLRITPDGTITVKSGFAWDGVTPKFNFLHITWGWFDGMAVWHKRTGEFRPYSYYGSMLHSVLYYYKRCAPITRKEADLILYDALKETGFMWAKPYYWLSRALGGVFSGWKYK